MLCTSRYVRHAGHSCEGGVSLMQASIVSRAHSKYWSSERGILIPCTKRAGKIIHWLQLMPMKMLHLPLWSCGMLFHTSACFVHAQTYWSHVKVCAKRMDTTKRYVPWSDAFDSVAYCEDEVKFVRQLSTIHVMDALRDLLYSTQLWSVASPHHQLLFHAFHP